MIMNKLRELGEYVEEMDRIKPIELLETNLRKIEKEFPTEQNDLEDKFNEDVFKVVEEYRKKGASNSVIICELYNILISFLRKTLIEEQVESLGIDRKMYKEEMRLLFKGKKT